MFQPTAEGSDHAQNRLPGLATEPAHARLAPQPAPTCRLAVGWNTVRSTKSEAPTHCPGLTSLRSGCTGPLSQTPLGSATRMRPVILPQCRSGMDRASRRSPPGPAGRSRPRPRPPAHRAPLPRRFPHPCAGTHDGPTDDWSSRVRPKCAPGPGNTCALSSASSQDRPRGYGDSGPAVGWNSRRSERKEAKNGRGIGIIGRPEGAQPPAQPQEVVYCAPCSQSVTARGS